MVPWGGIAAHRHGGRFDEARFVIARMIYIANKLRADGRATKEETRVGLLAATEHFKQFGFTASMLRPLAQYIRTL